ncbi:DUF1203 domain-containing protein [Streptomyces sp. GQFP]|uniref:DUF1203 domain-containing protein n=1 Tax=Streptomyces sp. GQFP TaxID=2907545 RepID=UPI001F408C84|nr:DUF1203 domain-containing protein [Streptomyces sp. GQFP]UIX34565.1 DUF1203 domain-containing protein [Streptomyces sp. GQFP]
MTTHATTRITYAVRPIDPLILKGLRSADDAGRELVPLTDAEGGSPLRCCLRHSTPGERIALISYAPLRRWAAETGAEPGPYDEQGPVFIHAEACEGPVAAGEGFPFARARRVLRRYSREGRIVGGRLVEQVDESAFEEAFADPGVAVVHVRAVEYGCFLYEVRRRG